MRTCQVFAQTVTYIVSLNIYRRQIIKHVAFYAMLNCGIEFANNTSVITETSKYSFNPTYIDLEMVGDQSLQ